MDWIKKMIPPKINLGNHYNKTIDCIVRNSKKQDGYILGFKVPDFQRPLVWTIEQKINLINSLWCGVPIGTYTVNECGDSEFNLIIIDGQQRLNAIESYINDDFKVYDMFYSELDTKLKGRFKNSIFPQYVTNSDDIEYLKNYYNLMNFGGTAHKESEKAINKLL